MVHCYEHLLVEHPFITTGRKSGSENVSAASVVAAADTRSQLRTESLIKRDTDCMQKLTFFRLLSSYELILSLHKPP
jgi:hypothetical protein